MNAAEFKKVYPVFSEVKDDEIDKYLNEFPAFEGGKSFWGTNYDLAQGLWCAHTLALCAVSNGAPASANTSAGNISSEKIGNVAISYTVPKYAEEGTAEVAEYSTTFYGRRFLRLREQQGPAVILIKR